MLRLLSYVAGLALLVAAAVWLADRPGAVTVEWLGWHAETSVPVLLLVLLAVLGLLWLALRLLTGLVRLPLRWTAARGEARRRKGYQALSDGLAAATAGQAQLARRHADRARKLLGNPALTAYLSARAAQLSGEEEDARRHFSALLERPETAAVGLRGLLEDALRRGDDERTIELAERSRIANGGDPWLADLLFRLLIKTGRLREAQELVVDAGRRRAWPSPEAARRRALVMNERAARAEEQGDPRTALAMAKGAVAAEPALAPAVVRLARLQLAVGKPGRAATALTRAWAQSPAPELIAAWDALAPGEAPLGRLRRLEKLTAANPGHPLSHLALGEAALDAKLWGQARRHLAALAETAPCAEGYHLLARLEQEEYKDETAARGWLDKAAAAPAAPQWSCAACGGKAASWSLACPQCGEIDRLARS